MNETRHKKAHIGTRIYEWPLSYFVGLLIGLFVALVSAYLSPVLRERLQPIGTYLFLSGWILMIGGAFGGGVEKFIKLKQPTKAQIRIKKASIFLGIALSTIAFPLFSQPDKEEKENKSEMATPRKPSD